MNLLPLLDPTAYSWNQSKENPSLWQRRALGAESSWMLKPREYREIFIAATLMLSSPVSITMFDEAVELAWLHLKLEVLDIAVTTTIGDDGSSFIQYQSPRDEAEDQAWLKRTMFIEHETSALSFKELKDQIVTRKEVQDTNSAHIFVNSKPDDRNSTIVQDCQIMLNVDHQITDGIGTRILFGKFLSCLAKSISEPKREVRDVNRWTRNGRNLSVPWIEVMNEEQVVSGHDFEKITAENKVNLSKLVNKTLFYNSRSVQ
jgi:hypothetical protein